MAEQEIKTVELRPNIYQIRAVKPGSHVYLIKGQRKNVLIDTGMVSGFPNLKEWLAELGLKLDNIRLIIMTHLIMTHQHFDHIFSIS